MNQSTFAHKLLDWFDNNQRAMPWRNTNDPYKIWLSEVILQQTRVNQGLEYYIKFVNHYPDVCSLANAQPNDVLRLWQGLGYYSRARNLHKLSKIICSQHNGIFPENVKDLLALPGIGPYTAAAIASIAFNVAVPAIDGNAYRVLSRFFAIEHDIRKPNAQRVFADIALNVIDQQNPGAFNQGIMELGATICLPRNPKCSICPFNENCVGFIKNLWPYLPNKSVLPQKTNITLYCFVVVKNNTLALIQRPSKGIWAHLFMPPYIETADNTLADVVGNLTPIATMQHLLTHRKINIVLLQAEANNPRLANVLQGAQYYTAEQVAQLPKPQPIANFLLNYFF